MYLRIVYGVIAASDGRAKENIFYETTECMINSESFINMAVDMCYFNRH